MFDEMLVIASRGMVKDLINYLLFHHCFPVLYLILSFNSILGSGLGSGPKKVAQIWSRWNISGNFCP